VPVFDDKFKAQALNQLTELENESEIKSKIQTEMDHQDETDQEKNVLSDFDSNEMRRKLTMNGKELNPSDELNNNTYMNELIKTSFEERSNQNSMVEVEQEI